MPILSKATEGSTTIIPPIAHIVRTCFSGDMERFACGYCGSEQIVERRGGTIGLRLVDAVALIQKGTDKTAAELALVRLDRELAAARASQQQADSEFFRLNNSNSAPAVAVIVIAALTLLGALAALGEAGGEGDTVSVLGPAVFMGGAIVALVLASKENGKAHKRYASQRSQFSNPHVKQIELLEMQIANQRRLIHS